MVTGQRRRLLSARNGAGRHRLIVRRLRGGRDGDDHVDDEAGAAALIVLDGITERVDSGEPAGRGCT